MMTRRASLALAVTIAAISAALPAAARPANGGICSWISNKQLASFGLPTQCKPVTLNGGSALGFSSSSGTWATKAGGTGPHLQINVNTFQNTSSRFWQLGIKQMNDLGNSVKGIGDRAHESSDSHSAKLIFVAGKKICTIGMDTSRPLSLTAFNALAKTVAAKL
jgi:hypothetical protein